jgi:hypothetical protein
MLRTIEACIRAVIGYCYFQRVISRIIFWWLMPLTFVLGLHLPLTLFWLLVTLRVAKFVAHLLTRPTQALSNGKLRILLVGDSIPPKIDGVAIRVSHGMNLLSVEFTANV